MVAFVGVLEDFSDSFLGDLSGVGFVDSLGVCLDEADVFFEDLFSGVFDGVLAGVVFFFFGLISSSSFSSITSRFDSRVVSSVSLVGSLSVGSFSLQY